MGATFSSAAVAPLRHCRQSLLAGWRYEVCIAIMAPKTAGLPGLLVGTALGGFAPLEIIQ